MDYPLRLHGILYTANLVELGAQAAAAHASIGDLKGNHTGLLIGLQNVTLMTSTVSDCSEALHITARQLHFDGNGALYNFEISSQGQKYIEGRATLKMQGEAE
jgi:predicted hotdog family 3-hydroxylacyl-ACP dehydratase